jgi:hypothetical protein
VSDELPAPIEGQALIYATADGTVRVEVLLGDETFWLTINRMAELFGTTKQTISYHLRQIYDSGELSRDATVKGIVTVQKEGSRNVSRTLEHYNLDAVISVGYRVNSRLATQFRIWATRTLKEFIVKGFVLDDERLKQGARFGKDYFDELLERIREIRASERRFYLKITDIYEQCSIDYDKDAERTRTFFATVQNKLHWAISGMTAAEIIAKRADADRTHMGLTSWKKAPGGTGAQVRRRRGQELPGRRRGQGPRAHRQHVPGLRGRPGGQAPAHAHGRLGRQARRVPSLQ